MDSPANRLKGLLTLTKRKQPETSNVPRELTETHLILYVAWRKLWMERDSATGGSVFSLSLGDLHRAVTTEASELAIDQLRLCSVVPDWTQMIAVVRMLSRRGVLRLHKYTSKGEGKDSRLHVVMSNQAGEDMLNSINAAILDQLDAAERSHKHQRGAEGISSKKPPPSVPRKKVYQIPACVLELHLEYERRDIVQETQAAATTEKKSSSV